MEFLKDYSQIPSNLINAVLPQKQSISLLASSCGDSPSCGSDIADCSEDSGICATDVPCANDGGTCSSDNECSDLCPYDSTCTCDNDIYDCAEDSGGCGDDTCSGDTCSSDGVTPPPTPEAPTATGRLTIEATGTDWIEVSFTSIPRATSYEIVWRYPDDTTLLDSLFVDSSPATITGLDPATKYIVNYRGSNDGGDGPFMASGEPAETKPLHGSWEWWSDVSEGATIAISAEEWNAFCDHINTVRVEHGLDPYAAGNFGSVTSDEVITAETFNHVVWAIEALVPGTSRKYGAYPDD